MGQKERKITKPGDQLSVSERVRKEKERKRKGMEGGSCVRVGGGL